MKISRFAVEHPVVIGMALIVLAVFGILSILGANIEFMSDISLPSVIVLTIYPGAGAQDIEEDVTSVLENDFVTLPNFKNVSSVSASSMSMITITFQDGADPYDQLPEVRNRINEKLADLPDGISGIPQAIVGGADMLPIISFSVDGGADVAATTSYLENKLRPRITAIPGVSNVDIVGGKKLRVNARLRLDDLAARDISALSVYQILTYSNVGIPAGTVEYAGRSISARYDGSFSSLQDIRDLPVGVADNVIIRLSDVADVELAYPDDEYYVTDGVNPIIVVEVAKRSDGNALKIAAEVKKLLAECEAETSGALSFNIIGDDSRTINASLATVIRSGVSGIIMAVVVIFLFLIDARATLIIALSIPLSILFTFVGMRICGITINLMSLSGIVVALGMIVDGSIVMLEQVYRYYGARNDRGKKLYTAREAVFIGSEEVGPSILASTATTIVVFIPIAALSGIVGMILKDVSLTLIMALAASFCAAIIVVPFLMRLFLKEDGPKNDRQNIATKSIDKVEKLYRRLIAWALAQWKFVIIIALGVLAVSMLTVGALGVAFIPSTDAGDFYIDLDFPSGYSLDKTHAQVREAAKLLRQNVPEVQNAVFFPGKNQSTAAGGSAPNTAYARVVLVPVSERKRGVHEIILQMQEVLAASIPDADVKVSNGGFDKLVGYVSGGGGYGLTLASEDMQSLYETASTIAEYLKTDPDVVNVSLDSSFDTNTFVIDAAHEYMSSLGISSYEAATTAAILFYGVDAGRFRGAAENERFDVRLFSDVTGGKVTADDVANIRVVSAAGESVSFANISDIKIEQSVSRINHTDREKTITVSATLTSEDTSGVNARMNDWLKRNPLPRGVRGKAGGIIELLGDSIPPMMRALAIAFFLVYTVMVLQFERFRQPLVIMGSVPFCVIGVVLGLLLFGSSMNLIALLGVVSLGGIAVNNGIILIDYINSLRKTRANEAGFESEETFKSCVIDGAASRIRPIFMTTLTTMLGVAPMAFSRGEGAEIYAPLGQAIAGGLLTSTLITLFVIPILYYITELGDLKKRNAEQENNQSSFGAGGEPQYSSAQIRALNVSRAKSDNGASSGEPNGNEED